MCNVLVPGFFGTEDLQLLYGGLSQTSNCLFILLALHMRLFLVPVYLLFL